MVITSLANSAAGGSGRRGLGLAVGGIVLATPALLALRSSPAAAQARSALDLIKSAPAVSSFVEILKNHGFEKEFSAAGSFGFFIPVNGAIQRVSALQIERFRADKEFARNVVLNHITNFGNIINGFGGTGTSASQPIRTKAGNTLTLVSGGSSPPTLAGYPVTYTNIRARNGYCHALDGVLMV
jgi:uncharacterized surface protein with fasciclin (FAS1) repeats